tara:strand:- start:1424 stop:1666 length:243 start_codon:yes stop_codon:yes gene_type:complete
MKRLFFSLPFIFLIWGCSNTSNKVDTQEISETQRQREFCLDWYAYRIDTTKATKALNLKTQTESELMAYCEFFKNVADTE